jgi:hypothetical protein
LTRKTGPEQLWSSSQIFSSQKEEKIWCEWQCFRIFASRKKQNTSSLSGSVTLPRLGFLVVVKVFEIRKIILVGIKKFVTLHSQSKNGLQKQQFFFKKAGETSGLKMQNLITYSGHESGKVL